MSAMSTHVPCLSDPCATLRLMANINGWDVPREERRLYGAVCSAILGGLEPADVRRIMNAAISETVESPTYRAQRDRVRDAA